MKVSDVINRIQDIDLAITKVSDVKNDLSDTDRKHVIKYLSDYKECLKSRGVEGDFNKSK